MPMYDLLEYSSDNYSIISRSLWNYCRDEVNDNANENNVARYKINNNETITSKCSEYKAKMTGSTPNNDNILDARVVGPVKHLTNFWNLLISHWLTVK